MSEARSIIRHGSIYMLASLLNRGSSIILVLIYTHFLTEAKYGVFGLLLVAAEIASTIIAVQLGHSIGRYYFETDDERERNRIVSTCLISLYALILASAPVIYLVSPAFTHWIIGQEVIEGQIDTRKSIGLLFFVGYLAYMFDGVLHLGLNYLRAKRQSKRVLIYSAIKTAVLIIATLTLVVLLELSLRGVLLSLMVAAIGASSLTTIMVFREVGVGWSYRSFSDLVKYGAMFVPGLLGEMGGRFGERYLINVMISLDAVGVFFFAFRIHRAVSMMVIRPFAEIYHVRRYETLRDDEQDTDGPRLFTYLYFTVAAIAIPAAILSPEIVAVLAPAHYAQAATLLPILVVASLISTIYLIVELGIWWSKKTHRLSAITIFVGVVHLAATFYFIEWFGLIGAAFTRLGSTTLRIALTVFATRRLPGPKPQWKLLFYITAVSGVGYIMGQLIGHQIDPIKTSLRFLVGVSLPAAMFWGPWLFTQAERKALWRMLMQKANSLKNKVGRRGGVNDADANAAREV